MGGQSPGESAPSPTQSLRALTHFAALLCVHKFPGAKKHCTPEQAWALQKDVVEKLKVYFYYYFLIKYILTK